MFLFGKIRRFWKEEGGGFFIVDFSEKVVYNKCVYISTRKREDYE